MTQRAPNTLVSIDAHQDEPGLLITDHIDHRQCHLTTPHPVTPTTTPTDEFYFPVDHGARITTDHLTIPHTCPVCVRNHAGWMIAELSSGDAQTFPDDLYSIELSAPIKLYIVLEAPIDIHVTPDAVHLALDEPTTVRVGARSYHEHPAATITTPPDPHALMDAVSAFSSALKTTTPERSYPTLRGHPPLLTLGDTLDIPRVLTPPDTGVTIELPPDTHHIFAAAPLAYYLAAQLQPGPTPQLTTTTGLTHPLEHPDGIHHATAQLLKHVFFLDCLTRTEGYYPINLYERNQLEPHLDLDFQTLYSQTIPEQLDAYLTVPHHVIEPYLPRWKLTAHVDMTPDHAPYLPFLVDDLATIQPPNTTPIEPTQGPSLPQTPLATTADFTRSTSRTSHTNTTTTRSTQPTHPDSAPTPPLVQVHNTTNSLEQTYIGPHAPLGASKAILAAYHNNLERTPTTGNIDITVVCNDHQMETEHDLANATYGSRDQLPFSINIHRDLTTTELQNLLQQDTDLFHYIGHADKHGFECLDGHLDAETLTHTNIDAFFLNACTSYHQGLHLITAGATAGVVTINDVINSGAERVGHTLAQLLNHGFPLQTALNIAKTQSIIGGHYLVLGDGTFDITQPPSGVPDLVTIDSNNQEFSSNNELIEIQHHTYPTKHWGMGTIVHPVVGSVNTYYTISSEASVHNVQTSELTEYLESHDFPVLVNNRLDWSGNVTSLF